MPKFGPEKFPPKIEKEVAIKKEREKLLKKFKNRVEELLGEMKDEEFRNEIQKEIEYHKKFAQEYGEPEKWPFHWLNNFSLNVDPTSYKWKDYLKELDKSKFHKLGKPVPNKEFVKDVEEGIKETKIPMEELSKIKEKLHELWLKHFDMGRVKSEKDIKEYNEKSYKYFLQQDLILLPLYLYLRKKGYNKFDLTA
jgi:hypothetical protein